MKNALNEFLNNLTEREIDIILSRLPELIEKAESEGIFFLPERSQQGS